eukprot:CAMPEP_0194443334 /NCGR_PEP_ID=MMETSP0176-20130528/126644_1 /TAXON_ID=216777 /ORGANISM="Proboscia alata, Strain PI-D3" /LENGTH=585 /DNA_ID=CAMNT_0039269563 /DNA_START=56 /DNA_END=1810 /DNA_ORIENTATION=+
MNKSAPSAIAYSAVSVTENEQVDEKYATMKSNNGLKADTYESVKVTEDDVKKWFQILNFIVTLRAIIKAIGKIINGRESSSVTENEEVDEKYAMKRDDDWIGNTDESVTEDDVKKFFSILNFIFTLRAIIKAIGKIINGNPSQFEKELISQFVVVHHHDKNHLEVAVESDKDLRSRYAHTGRGGHSSAYSDHSDLAQSIVCTMVASGIFYGVMSYLQFMVDASKWLESSNDIMWDKDNQTFLAYSSVFALGLVAMLSGNYSAYLSNKQGEAKSKGTTTIFVKTVCYVFLLSFISIVSYDRVSSVVLSMPFASGEVSNWITKNVTVAGLSFTTTFLFAAGCRTIGLRFFSSSPIICMNEFSNLQNARLLEESSSVVFEDIEVNGHVRETNSRDDDGDDDRNNGRGNDDDNNGRGEDDPGKVMQLIKLYRFFNDRKNGRGNDDDDNGRGNDDDDNGRGNDDDDNGRGNDDDNNGRDNGRGEDDPGKVMQLIKLYRFFNDRKNGRGNDDDNNNGRGNDDDDNGRGNDDDNNGRDNGRGEDDPGKVEQLIVLLRELATSIEETLKIMEEIKELIDGKRIISFAISCQVW